LRTASSRPKETKAGVFHAFQRLADVMEIIRDPDDCDAIDLWLSGVALREIASVIEKAATELEGWG